MSFPCTHTFSLNSASGHIPEASPSQISHGGPAASRYLPPPAPGPLQGMPSMPPDTMAPSPPHTGISAGREAMAFSSCFPSVQGLTGPVAANLCSQCSSPLHHSSQTPCCPDSANLPELSLLACLTHTSLSLIRCHTLTQSVLSPVCRFEVGPQVSPCPQLQPLVICTRTCVCSC